MAEPCQPHLLYELRARSSEDPSGPPAGIFSLYEEGPVLVIRSSRRNRVDRGIRHAEILLSEDVSAYLAPAWWTNKVLTRFVASSWMWSDGWKFQHDILIEPDVVCRECGLESGVDGEYVVFSSEDMSERVALRLGLHALSRLKDEPLVTLVPALKEVGLEALIYRHRRYGHALGRT